MKRLLSTNPGLKSRFATTIDFPDYSASELMQITMGMLKEEQLTLSSDAHVVLSNVFEVMAGVHDRENGNGRAVRNLLERAKRSQALRLMEMDGPRTKEELSLLTEADFAECIDEMCEQPANDGSEAHAFGHAAHPVAIAR